ncbi:MAG: NADH-quinone oxidoreductase subunit M, partial [Methylococcales bacterium]
MILLILIIVLLLGGLLCWYAEQWDSSCSRLIALAALCIDAFLIILLILTVDSISMPQRPESTNWLVQIQFNWIP